MQYIAGAVLNVSEMFGITAERGEDRNLCLRRPEGGEIKLLKF